MEFSDLSEMIEADDWLIASQEITERRFVKRTPSYSIYKADWFGDVLVYEPNVTGSGTSTRPSESNRKGEMRLDCDLLDRGELDGASLMKLNLSLSQSSSLVRQCEEQQDGLRSPDSAYSSLSSTPEYHTKSDSRCEFEFPIASTPIAQEVLNKPSKQVNGKDEKVQGPSVLLLNKSSFGLDVETGETQSHSGSSWLELNELRLIAHEGFMLFMGASIEELEEEERRTTSLVIQMNHPKTVSLHDLLHRHTRGFSPASQWAGNISERLLRPTQSKLARRLTDEAKLNICQQVTNAMTYLHDKDIVHGKLSSVNIYIELNQRVKISLIDHDENALATRSPRDANSTVNFNLPALTYLAPELIKTIKLTCANNIQNCDPDHSSLLLIRREPNKSSQSHWLPIELNAHKFSKSSDIFAFGTLLFELFEERYPFSDLRQTTSSSFLTAKQQHGSRNGNINTSAAEIIYQIGSGQIASKNSPWSSSPISNVVAACWAHNSQDRPQFKQLTFV